MIRSVVAAAIAALFLAAGSASPASAQAEKKQTTKRAVSPAIAAMRDRQRKCGAEWRETKAAGRVSKGMKWPQYWSACNKRLKGG